MDKRLEFLEVELVDGFGLIVSFSDGTFAKYTVEQMANIYPNRSTSKTLWKGQAALLKAIKVVKDHI